MRSCLNIAMLLLLVSNSPAAAWETHVNETSQALAVRGLELVTSSGFSWPDGRQAIVTFWQQSGEAPEPKMYRCIDYFNKRMEPTGGRCAAAN